MAAIIHDIINECTDILAITKTWVQQDAPDVVKLDLEPLGYYVVHIHRKSGIAKGGSGLAVVHWDNVLKALLAPAHHSPSLSCSLLHCAVLNVRSTSSSFTGLLDLSCCRSSLNCLIY